MTEAVAMGDHAPKLAAGNPHCKFAASEKSKEFHHLNRHRTSICPSNGQIKACSG
jgi:hypothetical protein